MLVAAALLREPPSRGFPTPSWGRWLAERHLGPRHRSRDWGAVCRRRAVGVVAAAAVSARPRVERQQLKWLAYAAVLVGAFIIGDAVGLQTFGLVDLLLETLTMIGVYVGIGIAVLRYRLYEIDRLINRTLVYGTLTALLGLVYAVGVFGLGNC